MAYKDDNARVGLQETVAKANRRPGPALLVVVVMYLPYCHFTARYSAGGNAGAPQDLCDQRHPIMYAAPVSQAYAEPHRAASNATNLDCLQ